MAENVETVPELEYFICKVAGDTLESDVTVYITKAESSFAIETADREDDNTVQINAKISYPDSDGTVRKTQVSL